MREPKVEIDRITEALQHRLSAVVQAAYLYGSAAEAWRRPRDLDLLLVTTSEDQTWIFAVIADVQIRSKLLIHPTVVSPRELNSNPLFRKLIHSSTVLWQLV